MLPEWFRLIGIVIIIAGMALRLRTTAVVLAAAAATGLAAGMEPLAILSILGKAFVDNRLMTLFLLTLPAIGLCERFGLREQSAAWIRSIGAATPGRIAIAYQLFRILHGALGIRVNGHAVFVRPLVYPMSAGAIPVEQQDADLELVKAASIASENYGNFYGQNLSPVQPGVLLVYATLANLGYAPNLWAIVAYSIPMMLLSVAAASVQFLWYDRLRANQAKGRS